MVRAAAAAAAVAAVAAVLVAAGTARRDDEDGVQWRRWGGRSMAAAAFDGGSDGTRIGDGKAKMAIDTSGGDGRKFPLLFDGGDGRQLWQLWTIDTVFNSGGDGGV